MLQISIIIVPCQLRDVSLRGVLGELWKRRDEGRPEVDRHLFRGTWSHDGAPSDGKVNRLKC